MRRNQLFIYAATATTLVLGLSGCGSHSQAAANPSPTISTAPILYPCDTSQLAWEVGQVGGAAGHIGFTGANFYNTSATTCTLIGRPKLQMLDDADDVIPTFTLAGPSVTVPNIKPVTVTIAPGERAFFDLGYASGTGYGFLQCPASTFVKITPPENSEALTVAWKIQPYGGPSIQQLRCGEIYVSPVYKIN